MNPVDIGVVTPNIGIGGEDTRHVQHVVGIEHIGSTASTSRG
jgi:hypothetical protein